MFYFPTWSTWIGNTKIPVLNNNLQGGKQVDPLDNKLDIIETLGKIKLYTANVANEYDSAPYLDMLPDIVSKVYILSIFLVKEKQKKIFFCS